MERRGGGGVNRLLGIIEPAMTVGSAIAAEVPALAVGLGSLNTVEDRQRPFSEAVSAADEVREMLTYNPRSMEGQAGMQSLINSVSQIADTVGLDRAFQVLNEEIIPRVQSTLGEDAARELGSMAMMIPAVRRLSKEVFHGGFMDGDQDTFFVATDRAQAQAYAQENKAPVHSFNIDLREIATDDTAMESIARLGIEPLDKNWRSSESSIYELLDPNFEQYIGKANVKKLKEDLRQQGYKGISFLDFDALTFVDVPGAPSGSGRQTAQNIALFEKPSADIKQEIIDPDRNLMFLQNTSQEALESFDEIGGMPMPSLAVTKEDIPFEGFGEITLVGKPESFDPRASRTNEMFSADAYTVRAPRPMQLAKKNADDIFEKKYGTSKELDEDLDIYAADIPFELSEQSVKSRANTTSFNRIKDFFLRPDARKLFALDQGYERKKITKRDDPLKVKEEKNQELEVFLIGKDKELAEWRKNQIANLLEPEKVFVAKVMPETDYKPRRQKISPYTAEEVTKVMRKSSGPNQESGFVASSVGAQRAATAEKIKSLKQARERKDQLQTKEALEDLKDTQNEMFFSIRNQLEKYYEFDSDNFRFTDEVGDLIKISERKGLDAAFREVGFKDVPDSLKDAINEYKDSLRSAPTQYFESKPKRVVDFSEFGGAIVPKGSEPQIRKILEKYGITRLKTYETDVERTAARKAFQDLMFSIGLPATVAGSIIYGEEDQSV